MADAGDLKTDFACWGLVGGGGFGRFLWVLLGGCGVWLGVVVGFVVRFVVNYFRIPASHQWVSGRLTIIYSAA